MNHPLVAIAFVALAGCATPTPTPAPVVAEVLRATEEPEGPSQDRPESLEIEDPKVAQFVAELALKQQENRVASRAEVALAKQKLEVLEFDVARRALNRALARDPDNSEALRLRERLLFALGERSGTIALVSNDLADSERVRRQQSEVELRRLYVEARDLMDAKKFDEAAAAYDRLLQKLDLQQL